jgi:hypothetical protein
MLARGWVRRLRPEWNQRHVDARRRPARRDFGGDPAAAQNRSRPGQEPASRESMSRGGVLVAYARWAAKLPESMHGRRRKSLCALVATALAFSLLVTGVAEAGVAKTKGA